MYNLGPNNMPVYGAAYVYNSPSYIFSFQQVLMPPTTPGSPGLDKDCRFGQVLAASRVRSTAVLGGSNLFVGAPFANLKTRSDEAVYFYNSASSGVTTTYTLMQSLQLSTQQSSMFGSSIAISADDTTVIVGAPGYENLVTSSNDYAISGPNSGKAYVFMWNPTASALGGSGTGAYTMQAIFSPNPMPGGVGGIPAGVLPAGVSEYGFGVAVALSGNVFAVASKGAADVTGQLTPGIGNVYIFTLGASSGGVGQTSAATVPKFVHIIPAVPVSNALAMSMSGNFLVIGVQRSSQVFVYLDSSNGVGLPNYRGANPFTVGVGAGAAPNSGMGQIVQSTTVGPNVYVYVGQPNLNVGMFYISNGPNSLQFSSFGNAGGLLPGFGASVCFNSAGNYLFAGNFLNQPHALVLSVYFETLGKTALSQRLISNDGQTALYQGQAAGVFSNFGAVVSSSASGTTSIVTVGASLGPTSDGRVYVYSMRSSGFSLQAVLGGTPASNFGSAVETIVALNSIGVVVGAANPSGGYVNIYIANNLNNLQGSMTPWQQLKDPACIPTQKVFSCGANYGGALAVDGRHIVVAAHNFGLVQGTGRVYVYMPRTDNGGQQQFALAQTINSPQSEYGFGVAIAMSTANQNAHQRPIPNVNGGPFTVLVVASMGVPRAGDNLNMQWPFNQPAGTGAAYVYVRTAGRTFSVLQVLVNVPVPLQTDLTATGSVQSVAMSTQNLYIGSVDRNCVYVFRYNGVSAYSQQQVLTSPFGGKFGGSFGSAIFANPANNGLAVGAPKNGSVYFYSGSASQFSLIRALQAQPNANKFGSAIDFASASFIVGAPGANVAGVYGERAIMNLPQAQPSPSPNGGRRLRTKKEASA